MSASETIVARWSLDFSRVCNGIAHLLSYGSSQKKPSTDQKAVSHDDWIAPSPLIQHHPLPPLNAISRYISLSCLCWSNALILVLPFLAQSAIAHTLKANILLMFKLQVLGVTKVLRAGKCLISLQFMALPQVPDTFPSSPKGKQPPFSLTHLNSSHYG